MDNNKMIDRINDMVESVSILFPKADKLSIKYAILEGMKLGFEESKEIFKNNGVI